MSLCIRFAINEGVGRSAPIFHPPILCRLPDQIVPEILCPKTWAIKLKDLQNGKQVTVYIYILLDSSRTV